MNDNEYFRIIEGMIFVSNEPLNLTGISKALELSKEEARDVMERMIQKYEDDDSRGIKLVKTEEKYSFVTKQNIFKHLTKVYQTLEKPRITPAMLETLAIVAYKQPVTKLEVENIRGVNSDHVIGKLVEYELICEVGRADKIGKPILFGTTDKFLVYFGLTSIDELPKVESKNEKENLENMISNENSIENAQIAETIENAKDENSHENNNDNNGDEAK